MSTDTEPVLPERRRPRSRSFAPVYLAAVSLPSLMIYFSLAASPTLGFMLASAWILASSGSSMRRWPLAWLPPVVVAIVTLHFFIAASFQRVDAVRALASLVPLAALLLCARYVAAMLPAQPPRRLHRQLVACFLLMCMLATLAVIGIQPPSVEEWRKSVFPFYEPAVFALPFAPLLLYAGVSSSSRARLGYLMLGVACTASIQNLTLATCFLLVVAVSLRWWALVVLVSLFAVGGAQLDLSYYAERLDFSGESQNFSNLVYLQGWQMIGESWDRSGGFGLGFQQLGANGTEVPAAEIIRALREGEDLNVLDGGFVFSKLAGEFGLLGMAAGLGFLMLAARSFLTLRRIATSRQFVPALTLAHCSVLGYSIELFVRGGSYFTGTTMLLIASLWLIHGRRAAVVGLALRRLGRRRFAVVRPRRRSAARAECAGSMASHLTPLYLNGKFLAQRMTGVQRYAHGILHALDEALAVAPAAPQRVVLLSPHAAPMLRLRAIEQRAVGIRGMNLHAWEQLVLPWQSRDGVLLNLAGSASLLHPRQILTLHDAAIYEHPQAYTRVFIAWYRFLFSTCSRRSPLLVTSSDFSKARLGRFLRRDAGATAVVPGAANHIQQHTVDPEIVRRLNLRERSYWLAVGSANPTKNFARLVEAFGALPRSMGIQLVIVGGRNQGVFAGATGPAPDDDRFVWTGPVADESLRSLYEHALGFVFPSLYEGFGLPPLEAMACGCPVAAARAASIPEVCGDAVLYFDPNSTESIAAALRRMTEDGALRADLVERGRRRAGGYNWAASAAELLRQLRARGLFA